MYTAYDGSSIVDYFIASSTLFPNIAKLAVGKKLHCKLDLRNRLLLTVICCPIYHWLEVSRKVIISRAQSAKNIFIYN